MGAFPTQETPAPKWPGPPHCSSFCLPEASLQEARPQPWVLQGLPLPPPPKALTEPREPAACQRGICPAVWPQSTLTTTSFPPRPGCSHPPYSERKPIVTCSLVGSEREQTPSLQETKANQGHRAAGYHPPQMWACRADGGEPARE